MAGEPPQGSGVTLFYASILASPTSGAVPLAIAFSETITGGKAPYTFSWTFGDGGTSTSGAPTHVYTSAGTFTVTLIVTDSNGVSATAITSVTASTVPALVMNGLGITEAIAETESILTYNSGPGLGPEAAGTLTETVTVTNP